MITSLKQMLKLCQMKSPCDICNLFGGPLVAMRHKTVFAYAQMDK